MLSQPLPLLTKGGNGPLLRRTSSETPTAKKTCNEWAVPGQCTISAPLKPPTLPAAIQLSARPSSPNKSLAESSTSTSTSADHLSSVCVTVEFGINIYSCSLCNVRFNTQALLNRHIQFSTMHSKSLDRKQQRDALLTSRSNTDDELGSSMDDEYYYSDEDEDYYDEDYDDYEGEGEYSEQQEQELDTESSAVGVDENSANSGDRTFRINRTRSGSDEVGTSFPGSDLSTGSGSKSMHASDSQKVKKVQFNEKLPTKQQQELEAYVESLLSDRGNAAAIDIPTYLKDVAGQINSSWSRAVGKIRMHNEFARTNQLLSAHFHHHKIDDNKRHSKPASSSKILFEGTKFIKTSPSTGETVELIVRHLDDDQIKKSAPGNTSVVEVVGYYSGTGRQTEIGRTYLSYNSLTILLHDEIKKAAAEFRASSTSKTATAPSSGTTTPTASATGVDKPQVISSDSVAHHSTKGLSTPSQSRKEEIIVVDKEKSQGNMLTAMLVTHGSSATTEGNGKTTLLPQMVKRNNSSGVSSTTQSKQSLSSTASRPAGKVNSGGVVGNRPGSPSQLQQPKERKMTKLRRSFEMKPLPDQGRGGGVGIDKSVDDIFSDSKYGLSGNSTLAPVNNSSSSSSSIHKKMGLTASSPGSLLHHHQLQGHGHQHHDGIERRVTADVIAHFILSHITLERMYAGGAYTMHVVSSGARVGEVLGVMLDKFSDISSTQKC